MAKLPDPSNRVLEQKKLANGLALRKVSVPLGTVAVIYESRPNVTVDIAALAFKSGNGVVLKGGTESYETNKQLVQIIKQVLAKSGFSWDLIYLINPADNWKKELFTARGLVDVIIPRGGTGLINFVRKNSEIPVIETGAGVCHTFVDEKFDLSIAAKIIVNAKTQRPAVCNSLDTLVVHKTAEKKLLSALAAKLSEFKVEIRADRPAFSILKKYYPGELLKLASASDFGHEFLSLVMSIRTVKTFAEGLEFVKAKTSHHSEAILTRDANHARTFLSEVDAAVVYHNASTRFTDGGEFGMGAEVGISTQKLHVRGPMGAEALTTSKWQAYGRGQTRG